MDKEKERKENTSLNPLVGKYSAGEHVWEKNYQVLLRSLGRYVESNKANNRRKSISAMAKKSGRRLGKWARAWSQ